MALSDEKYMLLTTFKRDGSPVNTPVWVTPLDGGRVAFYTSSGSGKAKRLAHTDRVTVQACDARGKVKKGSEPVDATATLVTGPEHEAIRAAVVAKYGFMTKVTKVLNSVGGLVRRKRIPYADRGVIVTPRDLKRDGMDQTRLSETAEYTTRREELRQAEIDLMRQREKVASLRRQLPVGAVVEDYVFQEGPRDLDTGDAPVTQVRLSELFSSPDRSLVIYHLMLGKMQTEACPMCTMWIDGFNGVARHLSQNIDFAIVAAADVPTLRAHARSRGWDQLRLLSAGDNTFKHDLKSEYDDGGQDSTISVFTLDPDGTPRHFYTAHPSLTDDSNERGIDLLSPVWHLMDLTPQGRGDWYAGLDY